MSKEAQMELFRLRLIRECEESEFEWKYCCQMVAVSLETHIDIDEILDWTIMKFNIIVEVIKEKYKDVNEENGDFVKTLG